MKPPSMEDFAAISLYMGGIVAVCLQAKHEGELAEADLCTLADALVTNALNPVRGNRAALDTAWPDIKLSAAAVLRACLALLEAT